MLHEDSIPRSPTPSPAGEIKIWAQNEEDNIYEHHDSLMSLVSSPFQESYSSKSTSSLISQPMPSSPTTRSQPPFQNIDKEVQHDENNLTVSPCNHAQGDSFSTVHEPTKFLDIGADSSYGEIREHDLPSNVDPSVQHSSSRGNENEQSSPRTTQMSALMKSQSKQVDRS